jgi:hypothetical protein
MAGNQSGNAYALTTLAPIIDGHTADGLAFADVVRARLQAWDFQSDSPMAAVPQTYLARLFVLDDVYMQSLPGAGLLDTLSDLLPAMPDALRRWVLPHEDHLASRYLVFSSDFHGGPQGDLDGYLRGMWQAIADPIRAVWGFCWGFDDVVDADGFVAYMKRCQLPASLFFDGSNDDALPEQLKALYLKQQFARFAAENQGLPAATLRANLRAFLARVAPADLAAPTWQAGHYRLEETAP